MVCRIYISMKKIIIILSLILLSSCVLTQQAPQDRYNNKVNDLYQERVGLFPSLSQKNINYRQHKILPTFDNDWNSQNSIAPIIKKAIEDAIEHDKIFIEVDLRYYKYVGLGNIMFSTIEDKNLEKFINISKFDQQFFILFNFSKDRVTVVSGEETGYDFDIFHIDGNLQGKEVIFNVSNSNSVQCNIKFTSEKPVFSFLADYVALAPCDIREISNILQNFIYNVATLDSIYGDWRMKLFSMKGANYANNGATPKFTNGLIENVMNDDVENLNMGVFKDMDITRYYDNQGKKFKYTRRSD
ncbi:MAG: hypothetical protein ACI9IL_000971 [Rickettsiales bacterium]|jgi:hypothetical protein